MSNSGPDHDPFAIPDPPRDVGSQAPGPETGEARETGEAGGPSAGDAATDAWRALRDGLGAAATASGHDGEMQCVELCPICRAADVLRASGPPELRGQLNEFQREALLTLRALLDHYIERIDKATEPAGRVEDIPIT